MIELISFNFAILKGNKDSFRQPTSAELQSSANSGNSYASICLGLNPTSSAMVFMLVPNLLHLIP